MLEIGAVGGSEATPNQRTDISSFLLVRVAAARAERSKAETALARRFAPGFNPLALLSPGETHLSEIFRWMLDEEETHGQGATFRDKFVSDLLRDNPEAWKGAQIACEVPTVDRGGRIDLLMESLDRRRCVIIENKPWADWQTEQLPRYRADQLALRDEVLVHALIGHDDPVASLERHWAEGTTEPMPQSVSASGFGAVVDWIEACAQLARADRVRSFLEDFAEYCREFIMGESSMNEISETADLILAHGSEALRAAHDIAAALPLALARDVASRIGGSVEMISNQPTVRVTIDDVVIHFALFGRNNPWAGVTDASRSSSLQGAGVIWGKPELQWPRWCYLNKLGEQGQSLTRAVSTGDLEAVAQLILEVGRKMIG